MSADSLQKIEQSLLDFRPLRAQRYASATVLILSWKESDFDANDEIQQLETLFKETFQYTVERYTIPSVNSQLQLAVFLLNLILKLKDESLLIVYYGGHGGPSENGKVACTWAARRDSGPTLDWSAVQPNLYQPHCDVVILLDCCYAGQAFRGTPPNRVEMLAATDKDQTTPVGQNNLQKTTSSASKKGFQSFTYVLTKKMKEIMKEKGEVTLADMQHHLAKADSELRRQPFYVPMAPGSAGKIVLRRLKTDPAGHQMPPSTIVPTISLEIYMTPRPLDSTVLQALIKWLTKDSPTSIADITLARQIVSNAQEAQAIGDRILKSNEADSRGEIMHASEGFAELDGLLSNLKELCCAPSPEYLSSNETAPILDALKTRTSQLVDMVEDLLPTFSQAELDAFQSDSNFQNTNIKDKIAMRLTLLAEEVPIGALQVTFPSGQASGKPRFRQGSKSGSPVLVEYLYYDRNSDQDTQKVLEKQVARVSALLKESKSSSFRILPSDGYVHERLHGPRYGFIYRLPENHSTRRHTVLHDLLKSKNISVPLELRIGMAKALCEAMIDLHSIEWYHKAIKSANVLLFADATDSSTSAQNELLWDISKPYLVGFDSARPADGETRNTVDFTFEDNLYRHPDRWGRPVRFQAYHDLYSFGILLMEIAWWRPLPAMDSQHKKFEYVKDPERLRRILLDETLSKIAHSAGTRYANAVRVCLENRDWNTFDHGQFQKFVRKEVLQRLVSP